MYTFLESKFKVLTMGSCASNASIASTVSSKSQIVSCAFADFVKANCVLGIDKSVHIQKLECAFALFLKDNDVKCTDLRNMMHISVAHSYIESLISAHGWTITPGFTEIVADSCTIQMDTRYVIGVDVARFRET